MHIVTVPTYFFVWQDPASVILMLCLTSMLSLEQFFRCLGATNNIFDTKCDPASDLAFRYSVFSLLAAFLFYALLIDLTVMSTKVLAYVQWCSLCSRSLQ